MTSLLNRIAAIFAACIVSSTIGCAGASAPKPRSVLPVDRAANDGDRPHEIGDGVYSFTIGEGNHSMFVVGEDSVAVFEPFNSGHSQKLLQAIRSVTDKPVT